MIIINFNNNLHVFSLSSSIILKLENHSNEILLHSLSSLYESDHVRLMYSNLFELNLASSVSSL